MFIHIQWVVISKFLKAILNALQDMSGALTIREGKAMWLDMFGQTMIDI